jgi:phosphatidylglycerol lysyltransferase
MYAVQERSWVAMGDPVGARDEHAELIWHFHTLADRHGGWTFFYEVGEENLPVYLDLGLTVLKIGEEARVDLPTSPRRGRAQRAAPFLNKIERGARSRSPAAGPALSQRCALDAWLASADARKRFPVLDEAYLRAVVAVVQREGRRWPSPTRWRAQRRELSPT